MKNQPKLSKNAFVELMFEKNNETPVGHRVVQEQNYKCNLYYNSAKKHIGTWISNTHYSIFC